MEYPLSLDHSDDSMKYLYINICYNDIQSWLLLLFVRGLSGRDNMVVGFTNTYAISAYHHWSCEFESYSDDVYSIQHYVIKFISEFQQVICFLRVLLRYNWNIFESGIKHHNPNIYFCFTSQIIVVICVYSRGMNVRHNWKPFCAANGIVQKLVVKLSNTSITFSQQVEITLSKCLRVWQQVLER